MVTDAPYDVKSIPNLHATGLFNTLAHMPTSPVFTVVPPCQAGALLPQRVCPGQPSAVFIHHATRATQPGRTTAKEAGGRERE